MYMDACLPCICVPLPCSVLGGQKVALDPLEMELEMAVSSHVGPLEEQQSSQPLRCHSSSLPHPTSSFDRGLM